MLWGQGDFKPKGVMANHSFVFQRWVYKEVSGVTMYACVPGVTRGRVTSIQGVSLPFYCIQNSEGGLVWSRVVNYVPQQTANWFPLLIPSEVT